MSLTLASLIDGQNIFGYSQLPVYSPYNNELIGTVSSVKIENLNHVLKQDVQSMPRLSAYQRYEILHKVQTKLAEQSEAFATLISQESGLSLYDTRYEVGRAQDVLRLASLQALQEDTQTFASEVSPNGKSRKIFTCREPLNLALAITPFNHPLNQIVHKIAPAIVAGTPLILKPSEKTPLTAIKFAELLFNCDLPSCYLHVVLGTVSELVRPLIEHPAIDAVSFTGSANIGKQIAHQAGYKKVCLELGGNSPLIISANADIELASHLALEGAFRNSGQRCTAVKRIIVERRIADHFMDQLLTKVQEYPCGDPKLSSTIVGTVIDDAAAKVLEHRIRRACQDGAQVCSGGERHGALLQPTILKNVSPTTEMVVEESFGPLAPVIEVEDFAAAIATAKQSKFGLATGVVTNDLSEAMEAIKSIRTGTVNINQVPGYRVENSPFGGIKDSGLGIKEGVIEATRFFSFIKTCSLPF